MYIWCRKYILGSNQSTTLKVPFEHGTKVCIVLLALSEARGGLSYMYPRISRFNPTRYLYDLGPLEAQ